MNELTKNLTDQLAEQLAKSYYKYNKNKIKFLIENGADVNTYEKKICGVVCFRQNSLHYAVEYSDLDMIKFLIEKGININALSSGGETALYKSINNGNIKIARFLIKKGADLNISNSNRHSPLIKSIFKENLDTFNLLIENGAEVNISEENNNDDKFLSPLFSSFCIDNSGMRSKMIKILVKKGAELSDIEESKTHEILEKIKGLENKDIDENWQILRNEYFAYISLKKDN